MNTITSISEKEGTENSQRKSKKTKELRSRNSKAISDNIQFIDWKEKYGITISEDGSIYGPTRPSQYSKTPNFNYTDNNRSVLATEKTFLNEYMGKLFSTFTHKEAILSIVDKIVKEIINKSYKEFTNIIVMNENDFRQFREAISKNMKENRGISGDYHGINLGGLIIIQDTGGSNCFPLLFHEIGHTLYPDEHNNYIDEFRAMYFQILCTKKLESELKKIGMNIEYPDDYYKGMQLPSLDHKKAFDDARVLHVFQTHYEVMVKGYEKNEKMLQSFLKNVKQSQKSFI